MIQRRKILKMYVGGQKTEQEDLVAVDRAINIFINGNYFITLVASPKNIRELAIGHLLGQGIIHTLRDVERVSIEGRDVNVRTKTKIQLETPKLRLIPTACGASEEIFKLLGTTDMPKLKSTARFKAKVISNALKSLRSTSKVFGKTGGTHAAALFTQDGKLRFCIEDVGRHNAVDKIIGKGLMEGANFTRSFMVSTGRLSADMVIKCVRVGIPLVVSKAAPLESGILAAEVSGLTLVGFARGPRLNVYTRPERIEF